MTLRERLSNAIRHSKKSFFSSTNYSCSKDAWKNVNRILKGSCNNSKNMSTNLIDQLNDKFSSVFENDTPLDNITMPQNISTIHLSFIEV